MLRATGRAARKGQSHHGTVGDAKGGALLILMLAVVHDWDRATHGVFNDHGAFNDAMDDAAPGVSPRR